MTLPSLPMHPVGFLTDAEGKRTHAIIPLGDGPDTWETLPWTPADAGDRAFLDRVRESPGEYSRPEPPVNPIRCARLQAGITQAALAKALNISPAALSKQEQEGHTPRPATLSRALAMLSRLNPRDPLP